MRKKEIVQMPYEDIVQYECNYNSKVVKVLIGIGTLDDISGIFIVAPEQNYEYILIDGENFDALMAEKGKKPPNVFRKEDLWEFVDKLRPIVKASNLNGGRPK